MSTDSSYGNNYDDELSDIHLIWTLAFFISISFPVNFTLIVRLPLAPWLKIPLVGVRMTFCFKLVMSWMFWDIPWRGWESLQLPSRVGLRFKTNRFLDRLWREYFYFGGSVPIWTFTGMSNTFITSDRLNYFTPELFICNIHWKTYILVTCFNQNGN